MPYSAGAGATAQHENAPHRVAGGHATNRHPNRRGVRVAVAEPVGQPLPDTIAPTYADASTDAATRTIDFTGVPVSWLLRPGGTLEAFPEGVQPPAQVLLTNYDATSGHNVADVFARWYDTTFFASPDGDPAHTLAAQLQNNTAQLDPGHPLTDPCWVEVTIDGVARSVLVQVFEPGP